MRVVVPTKLTAEQRKLIDHLGRSLPSPEEQEKDRSFLGKAGTRDFFEMQIQRFAFAQSAVEDQCDSKITSRRVLVAIVGSAGVILAVLGAYDHRRSPSRLRASECGAGKSRTN